MIEGIIFDLGSTFEFVGTLLIGFAVFSVHSHVKKEQKIDNNVIKQIKREQATTTIGLILIIIGYIVTSFGF